MRTSTFSAAVHSQVLRSLVASAIFGAVHNDSMGQCADAGPYPRITEQGGLSLYYRLRASTWIEARSRALSIFGYPLVTIDSAEENAWIRQHVLAPAGREGCIGLRVEGACPCPCPEPNNCPNPPGNQTCDPIFFDQQCFRWEGSTQPTYRNWQPGEPINCPRECYCGTNGEPRYVYMHPDNGKWNNSINSVPACYYFGPCVSVFGIVEVPCIASVDVSPMAGVCTGGTVQIDVDVRAATTAQYQWQVADVDAPDGWREIADGQLVLQGVVVGTVADTITRTLVIHLTAHGFNAVPLAFRCIITTTCGSVPSAATALVICAADVTCDGNVGLGDFTTFFDCATAATHDTQPCDFESLVRSDLDFDGDIDLWDFGLFQQSFDTQCVP